MAQHIEIVGYDPAWEEKFNREARLIEEILGGELVAIHHIGSTAVKGLAAKPIIDIMPVVKDVSRADGFNARFEEIGYEAMGEFGIAGRRYFRKGGTSAPISSISSAFPPKKTSRATSPCATISAPIRRRRKNTAN